MKGNYGFYAVSMLSSVPSSYQIASQQKKCMKKCQAYRHKFSPDEDEKLRILVEEKGPQKWDQIAAQMPGRSGRQCRDRYKNYLIPGFFNGEWSIDEDEQLKRKYDEFGPQWSKMKQYFKGRSSNSIKNRWNYYISKQIEMKSITKENKEDSTLDVNALKPECYAGATANDAVVPEETKSDNYDNKVKTKKESKSVITEIEKIQKELWIEGSSFVHDDDFGSLVFPFEELDL